MELIVDTFLIISAAYLVLGLLFSVLFYTSLGPKIDSGVRNTPWHFKFIIFPGILLLWPFLVIKLFKK